MGKSTTWTVSMKRLADQGELGSVMVRLMMVLQDFALASHSMGAWKAEKNQKLKARKIGAARYFLRMQASHIYEAFKIIREIDQCSRLKSAIEVCDPQTKKSYETLLQLTKFQKGDDYWLMHLIRNKIGFHYDKEYVQNSLNRFKGQQGEYQTNKRTNNHVALTLGTEDLHWYFEPTEWVENDIMVHEIFGLPKDEDPDVLQTKTDEIMERLHSIARVFGDFAGYFIKCHAKA
jgi:hypothetical protein